MTQQKIKEILNDEDVFNQWGQVNRASMFHISTKHSPVLIGSILDLFDYDCQLARELYVVFRGLYIREQYDIITGILCLMYFAFQTDLPFIIEAIFQSENDDVKDVYFREFLDDFENTVFDFTDDEF